MSKRIHKMWGDFDTRISVIVPIYDVEEYLAKCVDSIINQTYKNLEIILVDDGSPDRCGDICDEHAKKDTRIKVIHKENGGLSDARNVGIGIMTGSYVTFVDSDDYLAKDYVESLYRLIKEHFVDMSIINRNPFKKNTDPKIDIFDQHKIVVCDCDSALSEIFYQKVYDTSAWGKMYKSNLFDNVRYPKGLLFEDLPTTYKLILKCSKVAFCDYKGYYYLLRNDSIEGSIFKPLKYESCINIIEQLEADKYKMPPNAQKALNSRILSFSFHVFLQIPRNEKDMRSNLFLIIKKHRSAVVFDFKARFKTQVAAILSYGGIRVLDLFSKYGLPR